MLDAGAVSTLVEVGAASGGHTAKIARWATRRGATLHVIDPKPSFDVRALQGEAPFVMHPGLSLDVLPELPQPDAAIIDGDHNWYTVIHELRLLDGERWPLTFHHDVDWPYGRRDMYYDPESVPDQQPWERNGIVRDRSELCDEGINRSIANAIHEGGPRNGVLTAIEDFMDERPGLELFAGRGAGGLGVLLDRVTAEILAPLIEELYDHELAVALSPKHASRRFVHTRARASLDAIALHHGTDKSSKRHDFSSIYERYLEDWRDRPLAVLEIGVHEGGSLRMWRDYFPMARIYGLDVKHVDISDDRIEVFVGDQKDPEVLARVVERSGPLDLIVDDGSHRGEDQQGSLLFLWPHVKPGGIYIIEDIHTSYLERWGMGWRQPGTTVEFLKQVLDDVNVDWHRRPATLPDVESAHFYFETCVMVKAQEES